MPEIEDVEKVAPSAATFSENAISPSAATNKVPGSTEEEIQQIEKPEEAHLPSQGTLQGSHCCHPRLSTLSQISVNACCAPRAPPPTAAAKAAVPLRKRMKLTKSQRIIVLLVVDSAFFLLELIVGTAGVVFYAPSDYANKHSVGYVVHSLALVADALHMLNDVLSLCVGLWAVKVANNKGSSAMYTYGWQRAETLGALVNGVFLVALCVTIFLEAIQRFVEPQVVSNPKLVVIVGCMGLASNILGLWLFHDHTPSAEQDDDKNQDPVREAEEGQRRRQQDRETDDIGEEGGNIANVLPQAVLGTWASRSYSTARPPSSSSPAEAPITPTRSAALSPTDSRSPPQRTSGSFGRGFGSVDHILSHPARIRNDIISASRREEDPNSDPEDQAVVEDPISPSPNEQSTLLGRFSDSPRQHASPGGMSQGEYKRNQSKDHQELADSDQDEHRPDAVVGKEKSQAQTSTDLNIKGIFLHVLGDALGNIGIIASALFIWLSTNKGRFYADPAISVVITIIILVSAVPLCRAASRILLQAVPIGLSVDEIKAEVEQLPGIVSCHHLHVWQLSGTKIVASLHIQIDCGLQGTSSSEYMELARQKGEEEQSLISDSTAREDASSANPTSTPRDKASKPVSVNSEPSACLLDCGDECADKNQCCPLPVAKQ